MNVDLQKVVKFDYSMCLGVFFNQIMLFIGEKYFIVGETSSNTRWFIKFQLASSKGIKNSLQGGSEIGESDTGQSYVKR